MSGKLKNLEGAGGILVGWDLYILYCMSNLDYLASILWPS